MMSPITVPKVFNHSAKASAEKRFSSWFLALLVPVSALAVWVYATHTENPSIFKILLALSIFWVPPLLGVFADAVEHVQPAVILDGEGVTVPTKPGSEGMTITYDAIVSLAEGPGSLLEVEYQKPGSSGLAKITINDIEDYDSFRALLIQRTGLNPVPVQRLSHRLALFLLNLLPIRECGGGVAVAYIGLGMLAMSIYRWNATGSIDQYDLDAWKRVERAGFLLFVVVSVGLIHLHAWFKRRQ